MLEFVSFNTAKLAAERGVKIKEYYDGFNFYQHNQYKYNETHYKEKPRKIEYGGDGYIDDIYAFSLYELQKHLREVFDIIVEPCINNQGEWYYDFFYNPKSKKKNPNFKSTIYKSFEEALDAGLYHAIDILIK
ncbi:MAG: hypothetical protein ACOC2W_02620 [bacterium]